MENLDSQINLKKRELAYLQDQIDQTQMYLDNLRRKNSNAIQMNIDKYKQFHLLSEEIIALREKFELSETAIKTYHKDELAKVDEEVLKKRQENDLETQKILDTRRLTYLRLGYITKIKTHYQKMINDTALIQEGLKNDYTALQKELGKIAVEKDKTLATKDKIHDLYKRADFLLRERKHLIEEENKIKNDMAEKFKNISHLEDLIWNKMAARDAELKMKQDALDKKEEELRVLKIQLDFRQASLQRLFDKLNKIQVL